MVFSPVGSAPGTSQIHPLAPADEGVMNAQPISTVASTQIPPVYTNSTPMATYAQGNFMSGYPGGWDPTTGLGMPPEFMIPSPTGQPSTSASQPMNQQVNASAHNRLNLKIPHQLHNQQLHLRQYLRQQAQATCRPHG